MIAMLRLSDAERRLIPSSGLRGPVPLLIGIMSFVMLVVAAAGLALMNSAALVERGIDSRYSIQIVDGAGKAAEAIAAARSEPGVVRAVEVAPRELRRTLERWLGPSATDADLPLPVIVDVELAAGANPAQLAAAVGRAVPGARLVAHRASLEPLLKALAGLTLLTLGLLLLIAVASSAAVVLAARGAIDTHRPTIEVMHGIGATDRQVARLFLRSIAGEALLGAIAGAAVASLILALILGGTDSETLFAGSPPLGLGDIALLALLPLAMALLATAVARTALLRALADRL